MTYLFGKSPSWRSRAKYVPRYECPGHIEGGFMVSHRVAPVDLWGDSSLRMAAKHALCPDHAAACVAELARRYPVKGAAQ